MENITKKQYGRIHLYNIEADAPGQWDIKEATHVRVSLPVNVAYMIEMQERGYQFVDRMLHVTINLKRYSFDLSQCIRMSPILTAEYKDEIKELAVDNFDTDRRFHVEIDYNQEIAGAIIDEWVEEIPEFYVCLYKEHVIGFLALKEQEDRKSAEIYLAAVEKRYRTSGAALSLYANALKIGLEKGYHSITGYISSNNTSVMNLYSYLGGIFSAPTDIFLRK